MKREFQPSFLHLLVFASMIMACQYLSAQEGDPDDPAQPVIGAQTKERKSDKDAKDFFWWHILQPLEAVKNFKTSCDTCQEFVAGKPRRVGRCADDYKDVYRPRRFLTEPGAPKKEFIDFRVVFGYTDMSGGMVEDKYMMDAFVDQLIQPEDQCAPTIAVCGFEVDESDSQNGEYFTILKKEIRGPRGEPQTLRLTVARSAETPQERLNTGAAKAKQDLRSKRARASFEEGACTANAVFYVGHARKGGGPSFEPPVRLPNGRVDFSYYEQSKTSIRKLTDTLANCPERPAIMGVFGCDSQNLFGRDLRASAPNTRFVLSGTNNYTASGTTQAMAALDAVLAKRCSSDFEKSVNGLKTVNNRKVSPVTVDPPKR